MVIGEIFLQKKEILIEEIQMIIKIKLSVIWIINILIYIDIHDYTI